MNGNAKCAICTKTVYAMERMDADGMSFHKVFTLYPHEPTYRCSTLCRPGLPPRRRRRGGWVGVK
jgi:hypothetical protein